MIYECVFGSEIALFQALCGRNMFNKLFTSVLFLWIIVCLCYQAVDALVPTPDLPLDVANKLQKCASEAVKSVCGGKGNVKN
uniref:Uncharacterized protein n=1 Tax=Glossina palpalis gambiensis TaxID=67801 RepID=A0A1B0C7M4_9MUSC